MSSLPYSPNVLLLKDVLSIPTQPRVQAYVKAALDAMKRPYVEDAAGNIVSDPTPETVKPWFVGHMDTVHREHKDDTELVILDNNGWLSAFWTGPKKADAYKQTGIGGDDKVGVWAALEACIREASGGPAVGVAFVTDEEIGCVGSKALLRKHADWFKNGSCFLQLDRRGDGDAINNTNGIDIWTDEFETLIGPVMAEFKFKACGGSLTDIGEFSRFCKKPSMNISSGYHGAHSSSETVHSGQAVHSLRFALAVADACVAAGNATGELVIKATKGYSYTPPKNYGRDGDWWGDGSYTRRGKGGTGGETAITTRLAYIKRRCAVTMGVEEKAVDYIVSPAGVVVYFHPLKKRYFAPANPDASGYSPSHVNLLLEGWRVESYVERLVTFSYGDYVVWRMLCDLEEGMSWENGNSIAEMFRPHIKQPVLAKSTAASEEASKLAGYPITVVRADNAIIGRDGKTIVYPDKYEERLKDLQKNSLFSEYCITDKTVLFYTGTKDGKSYTHYAPDADAAVKKLNKTFKSVSNPNVPFVG